MLGFPIDLSISEDFLEILLLPIVPERLWVDRSALFELILELAAGCFATGELVSVVRDPIESEGFLAVIERPMRDELLELVRLRLELLVDPLRADGSSIRVWLFELAAGCSAVVEVEGFLTMICLPIRERVLLVELVADRLRDIELVGWLVVFLCVEFPRRLPNIELELLVVVFRLVPL